MAVCCEDNEHDPKAKSVEEALAIILDASVPLRDSEWLSLDAALDRVLAQDQIARSPIPAWPNSAMDGYALRSTDGDTPRRVVGTSFAGHPFAGKVMAGEAIRIMTGAILPEDCDTVVAQEQTQRDGDTIHFTSPLRPGANIRGVGEDLAPGEVALPAGTQLRPSQIGVLASLGVAEVEVLRRLRVAFFSTGDELRAVGGTLQAGEIYDSNRHSLLALLRRLGAEAIDLGRLPDDPERIGNTLRHAGNNVDILITSGGVSVGDADYIAELLQNLGSVQFWKMNMKPGRPLAFGRIGQADFFGLPGNPVSTIVTFYQFVAPALRKRMGCRAPWTAPRLRLPCATPIKKKPGRTDFQRGRLLAGPDGLQVAPVKAQSSHILTGMAQAECFLIIPAESGDLPAGTLVDVQLLEGMV
ncbi:gephyrin-like molybdotransferase Glp [Acidithiobacillus sp. AMEEHan]|uniref:molybdopterin molybdotransferase MoeA n=1 Tax=Acidithiobacillus sp. AMEEHan TaxID=2994951 RepID=UPI0027E4F54B|nr:gephyrin-like molybdotransferase Glp [Acidithiobacillus sp. AMEEHan]